MNSELPLWRHARIGLNSLVFAILYALQRYVLRLTSKNVHSKISKASELSTVQISLPNRWLRTSLAPRWVNWRTIDSPLLLTGIGIHRAHNGVPCWRTNSGWWILCVLSETTRAVLQNAKAVGYMPSICLWGLPQANGACAKVFHSQVQSWIFHRGRANIRKLQEVASCLISLHISSMQDIVSSFSSWFLGREFHCHLRNSQMNLCNLTCCQVSAWTAATLSPQTPKKKISEPKKFRKEMSEIGEWQGQILGRKRIRKNAN